MACSCKCGSGGGVFVGLITTVVATGIAVYTMKHMRESRGNEQGVATTLAAASNPARADDPAYVLGYTMSRIDGESEELRAYAGSVVLIVNTASKCGLTPQYAGLEALYEAKKGQGFVVLGFPANNFGNQEPGTNEEIAAFCAQNYGVSFPMFAKISVKGEDIHPLYARLTGQPAPIGGEIAWNFDKFLVDRSGRVVARFGPRTAPNDAALNEAIDRLLKGEPVGG